GTRNARTFGHQGRNGQMRSETRTAAAPAGLVDARAEVVGSLLRPPQLVEARQRRAAGELSSAEFKRIEDRAVGDAVRLQEDAGIDVVTDGELRRFAFYGHLGESFDGFDREGG